jgi:non-ribosomal peptide synthetase-like protein
MTVTVERPPVIGPASIEQALAELLAEVVSVDRVPPEANFFDDLGADSLLMARFCARVRKRPDLPTVSMKDVYRHPTTAGLAAALVAALPAPVPRAPSLPAGWRPSPVPRRSRPAPAATQQALAAVLAEVAQLDRVPPDANFFDDLGADSLVMARFCARVRKRPDLPTVSMKDVYRHPTIASLAVAFAPVAAAPAARARPALPPPAARPRQVERPAPVGTPRYVLCGALQLVVLIVLAALPALAAARGYAWISAGPGLLDIYVRSVVFAGAGFLAACALPIVAKWVLVGRWRPQQIRIWSLQYVRFWLVKTLVRTSPLALFPGSPLHVLYLRTLGAKGGPGVVILSRSLPVCTDLLTIGAGTVVRKDAFIACYRARAGLIQTARVTLGRDVLVSESTVLDVDTAMGDGTQLGHRSALHAGQVVPAGERWHGSPAERTHVDFRTVGPVRCGTVRRAVYGVLQLLSVVALYPPLAAGGVAIVLAAFPRLSAFVDAWVTAHGVVGLVAEALVGSFLLVVGAVVGGLLVVATVPRLLAPAIRPGRVYRLYGIHYSIHRTIARLTNRKFLNALLGDSSYIVGYLRLVGYDLNRVVQTGSNFGQRMAHESPYLVSIGSGTVVADGLSVNNAEYSSTSFRVSHTSIGPRNFLGNEIAYPPQGRTGDNCLLATKVMVPIDGPVREDVGLLGSPAFEIPRTVDRDASVDQQLDGEAKRARLAAKNRYNLRTIGVMLLARWMGIFLLALIAVLAGTLYGRFGDAAVVTAAVVMVPCGLAYSVLVERVALAFRSLSPRICSIYDPYFWWHERYWKTLAQPTVLNGTPFKPYVWRVLGVRIGRRVFDDGCGLTERRLARVGDGCTLNAGSEIQCHSQEDGAFKSDRTVLGAGVTVGVGALVHYGVRIGDGAVIAADSFVMKGEEVPPHAHWGGNPAGEMP